MSLELICKECNKPFTNTRQISIDICLSCAKKKRRKEKVDWLAKRRFDEKEDRLKTIEERVAWIEEWIYDHKDLASKRLLEDNIPF